MLIYFLLSALVPIVFFCFFIYLRDTEREPLSSLVKAFLIGCVIVIPILAVEYGLSAVLEGIGLTGSLRHFADAFVVAGFVEEGFKLFALFVFLQRNIHFNQRYDGIVYAAFISLGFASVENVFYIVEYGFQTAILRAFMAVPAHMLFAVFMGYHISLAYFGDISKKAGNLILTFLIPFTLHGLYDYFLFDIERFPVVYFLFVILLCLFMWFYGLKRIQKLIAWDKNELNNIGADP